MMIMYGNLGTTYLNQKWNKINIAMKKPYQVQVESFQEQMLSIFDTSLKSAHTHWVHTCAYFGHVQVPNTTQALILGFTQLW